METNRQKVIVVTGSSRGIGRQLTEYFLAKEMFVVGLSRSDSAVESANYFHIKVDVTDERQVGEAFDQIESVHSRIDCLLNNAGILESQYCALLSGDKAKRMIDTNILGTFLVSKECVKRMIPYKFGRIINFSSMAVPLSPPGDSVYAATKAAIEQFSVVLAKEVGRYRITVNNIGVSAIDSDMMNKIPKHVLEDIIKSLPIPRKALLSDITNVLEFFISESSDYITAQTVYLGGVS